MESVSRFLLLFLLLSVASTAQPRRGGRRPPPPQQQESPLPAPRAIRLDAVVTDSAGQTIRNLTAADFDLHVDSQSQELSSVEFLKSAPRRLILIVDDVGMSVSGAARVRQLVGDFISAQLQPGDQMALLRTRSGSGNREEITADKNLLYAAVAEIAPDPAGEIAGTSREQLALAGAVITLRRAMSGLGAVPGRKGVVLISARLAAAQAHHDLFDRLTALAADSSTVVYTMDMGGGAQSAALPLAGSTGGLDLGSASGEALARALQDQDGYYLLQYRRAGELFSSSFQQNAPVQIKVEVKNSALRVRSRTSPLGNEIHEWDHRARTENQELLTGLNSPFGGSDIPLQVTAIYGNSPVRGSELTALVWMDARELTFTHQLNGMHKASAEILVAAYNSSGLSAAQTSAGFGLELNSGDYDNIVRDGAIFQVQLGLRQAGVYQLRATVRDTTSDKMGKGSRLVEVPEFSGGDLLLSGITLSEKDSKQVKTGPGRRIFARGQALAFEYMILNPPPQVQVVLSLLHDGNVIYTGVPQDLPEIKLQDPKRRQVQGEVTLGPKIEEGRYYLQITVKDRAPGKQRQASSGIDFVVN
jgi:VWFA-related protein